MARRFRTARLMDYGLLLPLLTRLALAPPWPTGIGMHPKITVKQAIRISEATLLADCCADLNGLIYERGTWQSAELPPDHRLAQYCRITPVRSDDNVPLTVSSEGER